MRRILIHDPTETDGERLSFLAGKALEVVRCKDRKSLVGAMADRRPDVLVYVIQDLADDLQLLAVVREIAPALPIILLGGTTDLGVRRCIQELRPTYYGVLPLEDSELVDAVRGALKREAARRAS